MNDKLEAFRKRLRAPGKEKTNWQSWIGSPTAWLALFISSATAFSTFFYHSDELSVVAAVYRNPITSPVNLEQAEKVSAEAPATFTFVNSGSRPVALLSARMVYAQPSRWIKRPECRKGDISIEDLRLEETVVKSYDTAVRSTSFLNEASPSQNTISFSLSPENVALGSRRIVVVCVRFDFVTTDGVLRSKTIELGWVRLDDVQASSHSFMNKTRYLIKRNRFWTEVGDDSFDEALRRASRD